MEQIQNSIRCCATCAYWLGQRSPHRLGYVEVFSRMDTARCSAAGLNESRQYQSIFACGNYCRWQVLR